MNATDAKIVKRLEGGMSNYTYVVDDAEKYGIYIYRIDLNKSKKGTYINFYADDMIDCEDTVYTYNNIPPECLRLIDIDHTMRKYQLETCDEVADELGKSDG